MNLVLQSDINILALDTSEEKCLAFIGTSGLLSVVIALIRVTVIINTLLVYLGVFCI